MCNLDYTQHKAGGWRPLHELQLPSQKFPGACSLVSSQFPEPRGAAIKTTHLGTQAMPGTFPRAFAATFLIPGRWRFCCLHFRGEDSEALSRWGKASSGPKANCCSWSSRDTTQQGCSRYCVAYRKGQDDSSYTSLSICRLHRLHHRSAL